MYHWYRSGGICSIGVGRFRILGGGGQGLEYWGGGGARFRILGGGRKGGQILSRHMTSLRR